MARVIGSLAAALGYLARFVLVLFRSLLSVAGPALIVYAAWLAWPPLAFAVAGVFLILLDRRVSA